MSRGMERDPLRALVADALDRSVCPSAEGLARAAAGEADAAERRAIADHLATCASCSEEYRVAVALGPWAQAASVEAAVAGPSARKAIRWRPRLLASAALALVAAGVMTGLVVWGLALRHENTALTAALQQRRDEAAARGETQAAAIAALERRLARANAPALNTPIVDLLPRDAVRGPVEASLPRVPAQAGPVTLVMTTAANPAERDHEIEIADATGAVRWRGSGLRPNAERTFTATVPAALLPPGVCHVRLYERRDGRSRLVADYAILVQ